MRIISKFKDYYDGGSSYGIDMERVYVRETKEIEIADRFYATRFYVIGFCGELYPFKMKNYISDPKKDTIYDDDMFKFKFIKYPKDDIYKLDKYEIHTDIKRYNEIKNDKELKSYFMKYKTPVFFVNFNNRKLTLNSMLKQYGFFKVKDTIQAYQEIYQYISNILVENPEIKVPVGSDLDLLKSKGFDAKYSFRKEKQ